MGPCSILLLCVCHVQGSFFWGHARGISTGHVPHFQPDPPGRWIRKETRDLRQISGEICGMALIPVLPVPLSPLPHRMASSGPQSRWNGPGQVMNSNSDCTPEPSPTTPAAYRRISAAVRQRRWLALDGLVYVDEREHWLSGQLRRLPAPRRWPPASSASAAASWPWFSSGRAPSPRGLAPPPLSRSPHPPGSCSF